MGAPRRGATDLSGVLVIDKPPGMTSHDVVATVRRATGERRIGHAGTLDPAATGVLVTLIGSATRLTPFLTSAEKSYLARIAFGTQTDTDDAEGRVLETASVPGNLEDHAFAESAVTGLVGVREQLPPAYSAIKRDGVTSHRAARAGTPIVLEPRRIEVLDAQLVDVVHDGGTVCWDVSLTVSKGTYIRSIARDLGVSLGTVAHLGALRRTASGHLELSDAHSLDELRDAGTDIGSLFTDPLPPLGLPVRTVTLDEVPRVLAGATIPGSQSGAPEPDSLVALADATTLYALYRVAANGSLRADTVFAGGVSR